MALAVTALLSTGCEDHPEVRQEPESYSVRGLVRQLPEPNRRGRELSVWHEAIAEFKDMDGEIVGMESMTMGFPLAEDELAAGLAVGDRIRIDFDVSWDAGNPLTITAIEKLPAETRLDFEVRDADPIDIEPADPREDPPGSGP